MPKITLYSEWLAEGEALFGPDRDSWLYVCSCCGVIQCQHSIFCWGLRSAGTDARFNCMRLAIIKKLGGKFIQGWHWLNLDYADTIKQARSIDIEGSAIRVFSFDEKKEKANGR